MPFSEFLKQVEAGAVTAVTFGERTITVTLRDGLVAQTIAPPSFSRPTPLSTPISSSVRSASR